MASVGISQTVGNLGQFQPESDRFSPARLIRRVLGALSAVLKKGYRIAANWGVGVGLSKRGLHHRVVASREELQTHA
jgi:hypothetical protein